MGRRRSSPRNFLARLRNGSGLGMAFGFAESYRGKGKFLPAVLRPGCPADGAHLSVNERAGGVLGQQLGQRAVNGTKAALWELLRDLQPTPPGARSDAAAAAGAAGRISPPRV